MSHVQVIGRPLFPAFDVDIIESSGKFTLKYYPEVLSRTMSTGNSDPMINPSVGEEDRVWEHLEGLVEFLMQRNPDDDIDLIGWDGNMDDE